MVKVIIRIAVLCFLMGASVSARAHDYWFSINGEDYLLHRGHKFSMHKGAQEVPFDPSIITNVYCFNEGALPPYRAHITDSYPLRIKGPCQATMATMDSGYWSQTLTGTKNQSKDKLFGALRSWHALESVKLVNEWNDQLRYPLSDTLELVFSKDPFQLAPGDKLRLVVMFAGKPAGAVTVAYDGDPRGLTNDEGRINLRIRHRGLQVISASIEEPLDGVKADKRIRSTLLLFHLPE